MTAPAPQMAHSSEERTFWEANYWDALVTRDPRMDGIFYYAVITTGVFCRPSCRSRQPLRANVLFYSDRDSAQRAGFRPCKRCRPQLILRPDPHIELAERTCRYIEQHLDSQITLSALARELAYSPFHLQRTFKEVTGISPRAYADACRLSRLKQGLTANTSITHAMYDAGYSSPSRLYDRTAAQLGMTPSAYKHGAPGQIIRYSFVESAAGRLIVAATEKGICSVQFADTELTLREEFPNATLIEEQPSKAVLDAVREIEGVTGRKKLPLDVQATAFQRQVWEHLRTIPRGRTESYTEVAQAIGRPTAVRAVAKACATNPLAMIIPCHRVIRADGQLGGYRWGIDRKQALLTAESGSTRPSQKPVPAQE